MLHLPIFEDNNIEEEDDGYFSEGELSFNETTEVNDEYFYSHLNDADVNEHKRKSLSEDKMDLFCNDHEDERKLSANVAMFSKLKTVDDDKDDEYFYSHSNDAEDNEHKRKSPPEDKMDPFCNGHED